MTATTSPQIRMINDIAVQFPHLSDAEAASTVAHHIRQFWEPRMTADLLRRAEVEADSFEPRALAATELLR